MIRRDFPSFSCQALFQSQDALQSLSISEEEIRQEAPVLGSWQRLGWFALVVELGSRLHLRRDSPS